MDSFTPLSNHLSCLAKMFTLSSSKDLFFTFRCKWTAESWTQGLTHPCCAIRFINTWALGNKCLISLGRAAWELTGDRLMTHSERPWVRLKPWDAAEYPNMGHTHQLSYWCAVERDILIRIERSSLTDFMRLNILNKQQKLWCNWKNKWSLSE